MMNRGPSVRSLVVDRPLALRNASPVITPVADRAKRERLLPTYPVVRRVRSAPYAAPTTDGLLGSWSVMPRLVATTADLRLCMIIGGAECVWDDVAALEAMIERPWPGLVLAVNDVGIHWPRELHHWCSLHSMKFAKWKSERDARGYPDGYLTWGQSSKRVDTDGQVKERWTAGGSSGLLAVGLAFQLGCQRTVLCGVPMDPDAAHFSESTIHPRGRPWQHATTHWKVWIGKPAAGRLTGDRVRSMSWAVGLSGQLPSPTRKLLGAPDREWLMLPDLPDQQDQGTVMAGNGE